MTSQSHAHSSCLTPNKSKLLAARSRRPKLGSTASYDRRVLCGFQIRPLSLPLTGEWANSNPHRSQNVASDELPKLPPVSRNVHITSAAPGSMDETYHKILESGKSNSVPLPVQRFLLHQRHATSMGGFDQPVIPARQRNALAHGKFEVGGIVGR